MCGWIGRFAGRELPTIEAIDLRKRRRGARQMDLAAARRGAQAKFVAQASSPAVSQSPRLCAADAVPRLRAQVPVSQLLGLAGRASVRRRAWSAIIAAMSSDGPKNARPATQADTLYACGPGVERLAEEAAELFPEARLLVLSSDMPGGTERMRAELQAVAEHNSIWSSARNWSPRAIIFLF